MKYDIQLMVSVARMYYMDGLKQEEIAKKVEVSRASVSLILAEAKRQGIVEIRVKNPLSDHSELSEEFMRRFDLDRCVVVPTSNRNTDVLIELTATRAVGVFNEILQIGDRVGIAWGRTCYAFMSNYEQKGIVHSNEVIPLVGGSNRNLKRFQLNEMVRQFAEKLQGTPYFVHAPALAESQEDYRLYMNSSSMRAISEKWNSIDLAVVSCGVPPVTTEFNGTEVDASRFGPDVAPDSLPIGDVCARYFDIHGRFITADITQRIIGISADSLRHVDTVLAVVGGVEKAYSTLGALRTGTIDILVIDEQTARAVLESLRRDEESGLAGDIQALFRAS